MSSVPSFETGTGDFSSSCTNLPAPTPSESQPAFETGAATFIAPCSLAAALPWQEQGGFEVAGAFVYPCGAPTSAAWQEQLGFEVGSATLLSPCGGNNSSSGSTGLYQGNFALMLVLDETGSIGNEGAQRGVDIIDQYGSQLQAIGWVSFGDIICQQKAMTTNVAAARAELLTYATGSDEDNPPFFLDGGQDDPENGVDALWAADALVRASYTTPPGVNLYLHLVTDVSSFAHNVHHADDVRASVTDGTYTHVYMETGSGPQLTETDPQYVADIGSASQPTGTLEPASVDSDRLYIDHFATGAGGTDIIQHINYGGDSVSPATLALLSVFSTYSSTGGADAISITSSCQLQGQFPNFDINARHVSPATLSLLEGIGSPNFYADRITPNVLTMGGVFPSFTAYADRIYPFPVYLSGSFNSFTASGS